jgi:hypothetical protein
LAATLDAHGLRVWYSRTAIQGAQQWHDEIGWALRRCDWYLLLLSPSAIRSRWVKRELLYALNDSRYEERIVPLVARSCDWRRLSWTLDALQFIDLERNWAAGCERVVGLWNVPFDAGRVVEPNQRSTGRRS